MAFLGKVDFTELSETEKVIYSYLRDHFEEIPKLHMRDIALNAHAGTSSVMRLIHKLGYAYYYDFQEFVATQQKKIISSSGLFDPLSTDRYPSDLLEQAKQAAQKIMSADQLIFFGIGSSGNICDYAARRFSNLNYNASSITDPTFPLASKLKTQKPVLIVYSISGKTNEILEVIESLQKPKLADIISVTSVPNSRLAQLSDICLTYQIKEERVHLYGDLTSQLPTVFITELLSSLAQK